MGNKGITLVELIIAVAISSIILGATTLLVKTAQNDYQYTSETADLQSESQVLMEQLGKWIMEGNRIKVKEDVGNPDELTIYYIPRTTDTKLPSGVVQPSEKTKKKVIWVDNGKMYVKSFDNIASVDSDTLTYTQADEKEDNCIGEHIKGFYAKTDSSTPDVVNIKLTLSQGTHKYEVENAIKVRNKLKK